MSLTKEEKKKYMENAIIKCNLISLNKKGQIYLAEIF